MSKVRKGDRVALIGVVTEVTANEKFFQIEFPGQGAMIPALNAEVLDDPSVKIEQRFEVGDTVRLMGGAPNQLFRVELVIEKNKRAALSVSGELCHGTYELDRLRRVERHPVCERPTVQIPPAAAR